MILTQECQWCQRVFTYQKIRGQLRKYCGERCKANSGAAKLAERKRRQPALRRGSYDVPRVGFAVCKGCRKEDRDRSDDHQRRRLNLYGLTVERYDAILASQSGRCAICMTDESTSRGWFIDHDHGCCPGIGSCGQCIRGLLCQYCNLILGNAKDSTDILDRAKQYLLDTSQYSMPI